MILLGKVALGIVGTAVAGVGVLCSEGMIEVKVVERQPEVHHVYVIAPAMLVPIGMHFVGRYGAEEMLFSLAAELERAAPWRDHRPPGGNVA